MEADPSNNSTLPWYWFIELLASNPHSNLATIRDVTRIVPGLRLSEGAAEYVNELIALKCLEGLYEASCQGRGLARAGFKTGLDLSQSPCAVLHSLTQKALFSRQTLDALDVSNWDIPSFVAHKRAGWPKCTLLRLEEMIVAGTDHAAVALRERSGLQFRDVSTVRGGMLDGDSYVVSSACDGASSHQVPPATDKIISTVPLYENREDSYQNRNNHDLCTKDLVGQGYDFKSGSGLQSDVAGRSNKNNRVDRPDVVSGNGVRVTCYQLGVTSPGKVSSDGGKEPHDKSLNIDRLSEQNVDDEHLHHHTVSDNATDETKGSAEQDAPKTATTFEKQKTVVPTCKEINLSTSVRNQNVNGEVAGESRVKTPLHDIRSERREPCLLENNDRNIDQADHIISPQETEAADVSVLNEPPVVCMEKDPSGRDVSNPTTGYVDVGLHNMPSILCAEDILPCAKKDTAINNGACQETEDLPKQPLPSKEVEYQYCVAGGKGKDKSDSVNPSHPAAKVARAQSSRTSPKIKISKQEPRGSVYAYPAQRKRKVPWSTEEEDKLKEGVKECYCPETGKKKIPWERILEFGAGVFHPGRTPENLKDKWRNICKKP